MYTYFQKRLDEVQFIKLGDNFRSSTVNLDAVIFMQKQTAQCTFPASNKLLFKFLQQLLNTEKHRQC